MNIYESAEDYLERILMIREKKGIVYSIDIVHELNFSKPSVSMAMKRLRENGYIQMDTDGAITLLPPGEEIAARIYARHQLPPHFLIIKSSSFWTAPPPANRNSQAEGLAEYAMDNFDDLEAGLARAYRFFLTRGKGFCILYTIAVLPVCKGSVPTGAGPLRF